MNTPEQQAACAIIEAMGMLSSNAQRLSSGESLAYDEQAFNAVIERYGIHHNAVLAEFGR